jgi:3-dehydroquinate synthase
MSARFTLKASNGRSDIAVGEAMTALPDALSKYARPGAKVAVVSDAAISGRQGKPLVSGLTGAGYDATLLEVPSGEKSKDLKQAGQLYRRLAKDKFERGSWLVALGGGVVGDLTGFVAATYLRGISYVQAPTTLLAQVDSSLGGKTGVDIPEGKNLVGAFHHPALIWIDPAALKTLPKAHWRTGMAEVIKYGAIWDAKLFETLEKSADDLMKGYSPAWVPIITRCAQIKADVVSKDPTETKGLRALLNFGHSVGHAIEGATGYEIYSHGEAISIGMFVAGFLSQQYGLMDGIDRIRLGTLLTKAGLPARVRRPIRRERLMEFLARDKKAEAGVVRFVLLKGIGKAVSGQAIDPEYLDAALSASGL